MNANTMTTGKVRFSYVHLATPVERLGGNGEKKYSMSIIIPKSDKETVERIKACVEAAKRNGAEKKWGGKIPANCKSPLRDGDIDREGDEAYANSWFFNCSATENHRPPMFDGNIQEIIDPSEVYSGCYGRVNVTFFPYDSNGNRGVAVGLNKVQKLDDGEPLGGAAPSAEEAFGSYD